ncbi:MAG: putative CXXCH cytochrome family protein [Pseudomonadales bacterium]|jgi:predicted CXXCH cytochrome family protein
MSLSTLRTFFCLVVFLMPFGAYGADYVGSQACANCHQQETQLWQQSHHHKAMEQANAETVLGDFSGVTFEHFGLVSEFYKKADRYFVKTDNSEGKLEEFEISYTFGFDPLQQYLIKFPDGRYQALGIAWDSRLKAEGGQRWFHLYPDEKVDFENPLHWTGAFFNWNSRCASCHSTNLEKNYSFAADKYDTSWSEVNVACESCHGPASNHLDWTKKQQADALFKGFELSLDDAGMFTGSGDQTTAKRSDGKRPRQQIEACAQCHSRRAETKEASVGDAFFDGHQSQFLTEQLYFPDGQIRDEVFVYDSFKQSKMYGEGVVCSNCHEPHSSKLKIEGNGLCLQCHSPAEFNTPKHHKHEDNSGAQCVNCHMPERTYMVVDPRRDHSFKIPRPDISVTHGTPNACTQCHSDKTDQWAADISLTWFDNLTSHPNTADLFSKGWVGDASAAPDLIALVNDDSQSAILRASAAQILGNYPSQQTLQVLMTALQSEDTEVRIGAVRALEFLPAPRRVVLLQLLNDPSKAVRLEVARLLASMPQENLPPQVIGMVNEAFDEYIAAQMVNADMPGAQLNLGVFYSARGQFTDAEVAYKHALRLAPKFVPALLNLADFYRSQNRDWQAKPLLEQAIAVAPDQAPSHHSLGLLLVRQKQLTDALVSLKTASELAPETIRYAYVYAVALDSAGQTQQAVDQLLKALKWAPQDYQLLSGLVYYYQKLGHTQAADQFKAQLDRLYPPNGTPS